MPRIFNDSDQKLLPTLRGTLDVSNQDEFYVIFPIRGIKKRINKKPNIYIKRKFNLSDIPIEISVLETLKGAVSELIADQKRTDDSIVIARDGKGINVPAD